MFVALHIKKVLGIQRVLFFLCFHIGAPLTSGPPGLCASVRLSPLTTMAPPSSDLCTDYKNICYLTETWEVKICCLKKTWNIVDEYIWLVWVIIQRSRSTHGVAYMVLLTIYVATTYAIGTLLLTFVEWLGDKEWPTICGGDHSFVGSTTWQCHVVIREYPIIGLSWGKLWRTWSWWTLQTNVV